MMRCSSFLLSLTSSPTTSTTMMTNCASQEVSMTFLCLAIVRKRSERWEIRYVAFLNYISNLIRSYVINVDPGLHYIQPLDRYVTFLHTAFSAFQGRSVTCDDPTVVPSNPSILHPPEAAIASNIKSETKVAVTCSQSVPTTECSGYNKFNLILFTSREKILKIAKISKAVYI